MSTTTQIPAWKVTHRGAFLFNVDGDLPGNLEVMTNQGIGTIHDPHLTVSLVAGNGSLLRSCLDMDRVIECIPAPPGYYTDDTEGRIIVPPDGMIRLVHTSPANG